jgi:hypothetical protein
MEKDPYEVTVSEFAVRPGSHVDGDYLVETYTEVTSGVLMHEIWTKDNTTHHDTQPATISRDWKTGALISKGWYRKGFLHRDDGPAEITYGAGEKVLNEHWHLNGTLHREGGPAIIERDPETGNVTTEKWYRHGQPHRTGAPAFIYRDKHSCEVTDTRWRIAAPRRPFRETIFCELIDFPFPR